MATTRRVMAIDGRCPASGEDGGGHATAIEDLPAGVLALVLRRLDGASLAAVGCASSSFHDLAADPEAWRRICLALWPSVRDVLCDDDDGGRRQLFADAFPFPAVSPSAVVPRRGLATRLVSAVDLHHKDACVMSRVVETDTSSRWFLGSPFRVEALVHEGVSAPTPMAPAEMSLSWVLIDQASGRAVNASSRRPVCVERRRRTRETVVRFAVVLGDVALDASVTCDERCAHVREVSLCMEDGEGGVVSGRDGLALVAAAMVGARQRHGAEEAARRRYQVFKKAKTARNEPVARPKGITELCFYGIAAAAAVVGFLVMLTFR